MTVLVHQPPSAAPQHQNILTYYHRRHEYPTTGHRCLVLIPSKSFFRKGQNAPDRPDLDVEFHAIVARASGNRALMLAREPVSLLYSTTLSKMQAQLPQMHARNIAAHRRILAAMKSRDPTGAEQWMRKHILDFQRGFVLAQLDMHVPISIAR